jgi:hypothetical protein
VASFAVVVALVGAASAAGATKADLSPTSPAASPGSPTTSAASNLAPTPYSSSQCAYGYFCMWQDSNYSGIIWSRSGVDDNWRYVGDGFNDRASSMWNRRSLSSWVDADYPAGNRYACMGGGGGWYYSDLSQDHWPNLDGTNDSVSSDWMASSNYSNCSGQYQITHN